MRASFRRISGIGLMAFLAACGGGGGGGGDRSPPPSGPAGPPSIQPINYQGASGAVDLGNGNAGAMAEALYLAFVAPFDLSDEDIVSLAPPGQSVDEVESGPAGGSVRVTGRTEANDTGWIAGRFTAYRDGDIAFDGLQVVEVLDPTPAFGQPQRRRLSFENFRVRGTDLDVTYGGSVTTTRNGGSSDSSVAGSLLIRDNLAGATFYAQNFSLTRVVGSVGERALSGSTRVFDSRFGYLDVQSEGPWHFRLGEEFPHHGAAFRGTGLNGRYLLLAPLTPQLASIEYVAAGATKPTHVARVLWPESFEDQTTRQLLGTPVADGGASLVERPGATIVLDSRFTAHPQTGFVSTRWKLLFRPPGSLAALDEPQRTRPQLTLDVEGRYVIQLDVDDGVRTDSDIIALTADSNLSRQFTPVNAQLTPDESSTGGQIEIDLSHFQYTSFDEPLQQLVLQGTGPNGFPLNLTQQQSEDGDAAAYSCRRVSVGVECGRLVQFRCAGARPETHRSRRADAFRTRRLRIFGAGDPGAVASGHLTADDFPDLVITMRDGGGNPLMHVLYGNADGMLDAPVTLPVSNMGSVAIADVSSDGLADIVLTSGLGIGVFLQGPAGTFGGELSIPGNCFGGTGERDFAVADLNGDGRLDVVSHGCSGELDYYLQTAAGLQPPVRVTSGQNSDARMAVGDLNNDGAADVVLSARAFGGAPSIFAVFGVKNGLPGAPIPLPYQSTIVHNFASAVALADLNHDGRLDVISGENPQPSGTVFPRMMTFLQQPDGSFAAPSFFSASNSGTRQLAALDLNGDGSIDLATMGAGQGLTVQYGSGAFFGSAISDLRPSATLVNKYAYPEATLDLNRDGKLDFVYLSGDGRRVFLGVALGSDD